MASITLEGVVASVVFFNPDNGYTILRMETQTGVSTAAGYIPGITVGEHLALHGTWTTHPQYGEQFKIDSFEIRQPRSTDEIYRYLASGAIKNIGPAKARDIVGKFGDEALKVIENEPEKLSTVKGITMQSALLISDGYRRHAGLRRLIEFLSQYDIPPLIATRVYKTYADFSIDAIADNPYIITADSYGAQFSDADAIAIDLGFESDCTERVSAAIAFELLHNIYNSGHTFIPIGKLISATHELIGTNSEIIKDALDALVECGDIVSEVVAGEEACYLQNMHEAEIFTSGRLLGLAQASYGQENLLEDLIREIEEEQGIAYAVLQLEAIRVAASSGLMALTGGPGTGKTTTTRGILMLFDNLGLKTLLCAPTGRAAKRLAETCQREAYTIHRMLGANPGSQDGMPLFEYDELNPLDADAIIVDESSMIDLMLMRSLLAAMKEGCRLVMVGDADQLPPVGPGNVFSDIIRSEVVPVVALTEIFRQAADSGIIRCSHDVNNGIVPDLTAKYTDLFFLRRQSQEQLAETVAQLFGERLPKNMNIDPVNIQILSPTKKGSAGTTSLNDKLREATNPPGVLKKDKTHGEHLFRTGDKVMQIRNNYDIIWKSANGLGDGNGVFNGDVGVITDIDNSKETITVDYEDKLVTYLFEQLPELEPAYAMTVHKSQGSEYHAVILALTQGAPSLMTRNLLYTAMTRAKDLLVIVGSPDVMAQMVSNDKRIKRYSGLRARLSKGG